MQKLINPKEPSVKERILTTATSLFQSQGYQNTGINQIIKESGTAKASFYHYYPSKNALAIDFIEKYANEQLSLLKGLMIRYPRPSDFMQTWLRILKRQIHSHDFFGCQMSNLRAQIADENSIDSQSLQATIKIIVNQTLKVISEFIATSQRNQLISSKINPNFVARRILAAYEGSIQVYRLTGVVAALDDMLVMTSSIWDEN